MDCIDLKKLSLDELAGVIHLYPWYGGARKELCLRMVRSGGAAWGDSQYADEAVWIGARHKVAELVRSARKVDCTDKDLKEILREVQSEKKEVRAVGGDFFSQAQYDNARRSSDAALQRMVAAASAAAERTDTDAHTVTPIEDFFCTETMAVIFAEQGYFDQAKRIYDKLILAYPEKSAYFAAQIQKLNQNNNII